MGTERLLFKLSFAFYYPWIMFLSESLCLLLKNRIFSILGQDSFGQTLRNYFSPELIYMITVIIIVSV